MPVCHDVPELRGTEEVMECSDCRKTCVVRAAIVRVRVNGETSVVCEEHRAAIVRRIELVARACWDAGRRNPQANKNLQAVLVMANKSIEFEDLPIELPASTVL